MKASTACGNNTFVKLFQDDSSGCFLPFLISSLFQATNHLSSFPLQALFSTQKLPSRPYQTPMCLAIQENLQKRSPCPSTESAPLFVTYQKPKKIIFPLQQFAPQARKTPSLQFSPTKSLIQFSPTKPLLQLSPAKLLRGSPEKIYLLPFSLLPQAKKKSPSQQNTLLCLAILLSKKNLPKKISPPQPQNHLSA